MSASVPSLSTLLAQSSLTDHDEVLRAANAALKKSNSDTTAQHAKVVALLHLDRFQDAIEVFEKGGQELKDSARLAYAYALYKTGDASQAASIASSNGPATVDSERGIKHVLAQAAYRSENFALAARVYQELSSTPVASEEYDIRINSGAVDAQLEWNGQGELARSKKPSREDLEVFETAFNAACGSIARGEYGQGEVCLKRAAQLCGALEDLSEAEREAELLPIKVQQVYVLIQMGKVKEAEELVTGIPLADIKELSTRYIAQVNSIAASTSHTNPYLSHRLFHSSPLPPPTDAHFAFQTNLLRQNEYVIALLSQKTSGVASSTAKLISSSPFPALDPATTTAAVLNAAAHTRNAATPKAALRDLLPLLEKRPLDIGLALTIAYLYVQTANLPGATHTLELLTARLTASARSEDLDARFAPGLVATLVSLYTAQSRPHAAKSALSSAAAHWRAPRSSSATDPPSRALLIAAGVAQLSLQDSDAMHAAASIFQTLHSADSEDRAAIAGLVAALSVTDPAGSPGGLLEYLPDAGRLAVGVDAEALEAAGVPFPAALAAQSRKRSVAAVKRPGFGTGIGAAVAQGKAKRLRKARVPKNYVEGKAVDPERWLPLRDRSGYRPKGKKGRKRAEGLTQGGAVMEERAGTPVQEKKDGTKGGKEGKGKGKKKGGKW